MCPQVSQRSYKPLASFSQFIQIYLVGILIFQNSKILFFLFHEDIFINVSLSQLSSSQRLSTTGNCAKVKELGKWRISYSLLLARARRFLALTASLIPRLSKDYILRRSTLYGRCSTVGWFFEPDGVKQMLSYLLRWAVDRTAPSPSLFSTEPFFRRWINFPKRVFRRKQFFATYRCARIFINLIINWIVTRDFFLEIWNLIFISKYSYTFIFVQCPIQVVFVPL